MCTASNSQAVSRPVQQLPAVLHPEVQPGWPALHRALQDRSGWHAGAADHQRRPPVQLPGLWKRADPGAAGQVCVSAYTLACVTLPTQKNASFKLFLFSSSSELDRDEWIKVKQLFLYVSYSRLGLGQFFLSRFPFICRTFRMQLMCFRRKMRPSGWLPER